MDERTCSIDGCNKSARSDDRVCSMHRARISRHGSPDGKARRKPVIERVLAKVAEGEACWEWQGSHDALGYSQLRTRDTNLKIHRVMFEHFNGPVPMGMVVDHMCHNPGCVRPDHLRAVTTKQNVENFSRPVRSHNTSGYRGVSFHKHSGLWHVRVKHGERTHSGGYFKTAAEAGEAARALRLALHTHNDLDASRFDG